MTKNASVDFLFFKALFFVVRAIGKIFSRSKESYSEYERYAANLIHRHFTPLDISPVDRAAEIKRFTLDLGKKYKGEWWAIFSFAQIRIFAESRIVWVVMAASPVLVPAYIAWRIGKFLAGMV